MTGKHENPVDLDGFFDEARKGEPELSMRLMENILGDAAEVSAARQPAAPVAAPRRKGWLRTLLAPIGGIPAAITLATCAVLGIGVGYAGTDTLESLPGMGTIVSAIGDDPLDDFSFGYTESISEFLSEG